MAAVGGTQGYAEHAGELAEQYESIRFEDIYGSMLHLLPAAPTRVADIGAGSGRDAAALARMGHRVTAVEPTEALRREGQRRHASAGLDWVDDSLPGLTALRSRPDRFGLILLTAVWMHLDEAERAQGMSALASLLAPGGIIMMTLRHGPVPPGRRMFDVSAEATFALGAAHGLDRLHLGSNSDAQGRDDVRWSMVALREGAGSR